MWPALCHICLCKTTVDSHVFFLSVASFCLHSFMVIFMSVYISGVHWAIWIVLCVALCRFMEDFLLTAEQSISLICESWWSISEHPFTCWPVLTLNMHIMVLDHQLTWIEIRTIDTFITKMWTHRDWFTTKTVKWNILSSAHPEFWDWTQLSFLQKYRKTIKQRKIISSLCPQWWYEWSNGWIFHISAKSIGSGVKDQKTSVVFPSPRIIIKSRVSFSTHFTEEWIHTTN